MRMPARPILIASVALVLLIGLVFTFTRSSDDPSSTDSTLAGGDVVTDAAIRLDVRVGHGCIGDHRHSR